MLKGKVKIAFIHGRPKGHPIHALYAKQLSADFFPEDIYLRWHDRPNSLRIKRYFSWLANAFLFPKRNEYSIFFTECIRIPVLFMKILGLLRKEQKLVALMADESLYFLIIKRYNPITSALMMLFLKRTDAIICIGQYQTDLAKRILGKKSHSKIYTIYNGVQGFKYKDLLNIQLNPTSNNILFIANISAEWRAWYKGLDIMIDAFSLSLVTNPALKFYIVGKIESRVIAKLLEPHNDVVKSSIIFTGHTDNVEKYISQSILYLHCSRGDAFPTVVLEAMTAGLIPIISCETGTAEIVEEVDESLVMPLNKESICNKINWFFNLSLAQKSKLSMLSRNAVKNYSEKSAITHFNSTFATVLQNVTEQA